MRAARLGDHIGHTHALGGLITGALVGAGLVLGGALIVGTGGLALPLVIGGALTAASVGAGIGESLGSFSFSGRAIKGGISKVLGEGAAEVADSIFDLSDFTGIIASGSSDVFINSQRAARIGIDIAPCRRSPAVIALIATGSGNVFINDYPAARIDDKVSCGAIIKEGSENVYIGGEQEKYMDVEDGEVPDWVHDAVFLTGIAGAVLTGGVGALPQLAKGMLGGMARSMLGGAVWSMLGAPVWSMLGGPDPNIMLGWVSHNVSDYLHDEVGLDVLPSDVEKAVENLAGPISGAIGAKIGQFSPRLKAVRDKLLAKLAKLKLRRGPKHGEKAPPPRSLKNPEGGKPPEELCTKAGHPVDVASGRVFTSQTDFELPGRIAIEFTRTYDSSAIDYEGPLGHGWIHPYDIHLWVDDKQEMVILRNEEASLSGFDLIAIGESAFNPLTKKWLDRLANKVYVLRGQDGLKYKFESLTPDEAKADLDGKSEASALRLTEIGDPHGNRIALSYLDGRLDSLMDGAGTRLNFSYITLDNGAERLAAVNLVLDQDSTRKARLVNFTYDAEGSLINATDRGLVPYRYAYDNHLMIRETNRNGLSFHWVYEGEGKNARCVHTWGDRGIYECRFEYNLEDRMTVLEDSLGRKTTFYFNELDMQVKSVDPFGGVRSYSYGPDGELLSETDEIGRQTKYEYNDQFDCICVNYPDGTRCNFEYTRESLPQKMIDESGAEFIRIYDQYGDVTTTIDPLGNRYHYNYNQLGELEKVVDSLGGETKFKWNKRGQIIEMISPLRAVTRYDYDDRGRLIGVSDPLGNTTRYVYDALDRLMQVERPDGTRRHYEYDPEGNLIYFRDANGAETRFRYVDYNKLGERVDALGYRQRFIYDTQGNLIEVRNERDEAYRFDFDSLDRVIREIGFDGLNWEYDYDPAGQLIARTDPAGRVTSFIRDLRGRVIERMRPDGTLINFSYDRLGRLTEADAPGSELIYKYDVLGRVIFESQNGQVIEHEYDSLGRRIKRSAPTGQHVEFTYDVDHQLSHLQTPRGSMEFEYDKAGRITKRRLSSGLEECFYYDRCGQIIEQSLHHRSGYMLFHRGYKYDADGNLIELNDSNKGLSRYIYNLVERLREVLLPEKRLEKFMYDSTGNLLQRGGRRFFYSNSDRLTQADDTTLVYDEVGNLIEKHRAGSVIRFSYDPDNQLVAVESNERGRVEFSYDALGRRIAKSGKDGKIGFLWDGDLLLAEIDGEGASEYVFSLNSHESLCRFGERAFEAYHNDRLGTPCELTNGGGQVVWSANYDVYGRIRNLLENKTDSHIRFQGQYEDTETGLYYNYYRYYDPDSGRYITKDPIGLQGGINQYEYTANPINWIDPLGLTDEIIRASFFVGPFETDGVNPKARTSRVHGTTFPGATRVYNTDAYGMHAEIDAMKAMKELLKNANINPEGMEGYLNIDGKVACNVCKGDILKIARDVFKLKRLYVYNNGEYLPFGENLKGSKDGGRGWKKQSYNLGPTIGK